MRQKGYIYFVKPKVGLCMSGVKIGFSVNPRRRLHALQCEAAVPLMLDGFVPALRNHERTLHRVLRRYRMYGEWFATTIAVNRAISDIMREGSLSKSIVLEIST